MKVGIVGTGITGEFIPKSIESEGIPVICGNTEFSFEINSDARELFDKLFKARPETVVVMIGRPGYTPLSAIGNLKEIPFLSTKLDKLVLRRFSEYRYINGRIAGKIVRERLRAAQMRSKWEREIMEKREYEFTGHLSCL